MKQQPKKKRQKKRTRSISTKPGFTPVTDENRKKLIAKHGFDIPDDVIGLLFFDTKEEKEYNNYLVDKQKSYDAEEILSMLWEGIGEYYIPEEVGDENEDK